MIHIHKEVAVPHALTQFKAPAGTGFCQPSNFIFVQADSPAIHVMTDLKQVSVATTPPQATLAQASQTMISRGVRLLLVVDDKSKVVGLITARDTQGEKPIQLIRSRGGKFADLLVSDLMCPLERMELLDANEVLRAKVADIVETLKVCKRQHAIVGERDPLTGQINICGIFSVTQIGRQLGASIQIFDVASTFNEIEGLLSREST